MKLMYLTTHPIQNQVPVFRKLAQTPGIDFKTLYCQIPDAQQQGQQFGVNFEWDIPLLDGYEYEVLENRSRKPSVMKFDGCDTPGVARSLHQHQPDAVAINGWVVKSCLQTARACRRLRIPAIVRGEANDLRPRSWWKRQLHQQMMQLFDAYCPIGLASTRFYRQLNIPDEKLFLSPYCVDNDRVSRSAPKTDASRALARQRFKIQDDRCCLLFCGKLMPKKHPLTLLKALEHSIADGSKVQLLIVGDRELRAECEQFVSARSLPVTFAGFINQSEISMAYDVADCLVLPSDHGETWGLVVNEAFAAGNPAIVSDQVGSYPDLIENGVTGWVHRFDDVSHLASRISEAAEDPQRLTLMGQQAKELIHNFSPARAAKGIVAAAEYCAANRLQYA